jgi:hypothetical protein
MVLMPAASVVLFVFLWRGDMLDRPYVVGACVLIGLAAQLLSPVYSSIWLVGMLLNSGVAIYLAIRLKLSR